MPSCFFAKGVLMNKMDNLIPNSERTHKELVEMGRRGGIASGKARRERRNNYIGLKAILRRCNYNQMMYAWREVENERKEQHKAR